MIENLAGVKIGFVLVGLMAVMAQEPTPSPRPWMQGSVEVACSRDGQPWSGDPSAQEWHACECSHQCAKDPKEYEHSEETGGRIWDPQCEARCRPSHCHCPTKCET